MTAIPRGSDTRQALRVLTKVVEQLFREIQQLRMEARGLRAEISSIQLNEQGHVKVALAAPEALTGPYWEGRAKALYDRGQDMREG